MNPFDLKSKKSGTQAFVFYLVYMGLFTATSMVLGALATVFSGAQGFTEGFELGQKLGMVFHPTVNVILAFTVLYMKQRWNQVGLVLLALLSIGTGLLLGSFLGPIPAAILTTWTPADEELQEQQKALFE